MKLCDKIRYLREVEGSLRGFDRAMTQGELVRAIADEMDAPLSQSYLSQIESGARPHLTNTTRLLLAKFFKVHPGYLVDDPDGYHAELLTDFAGQEDKVDLWLIGGAERFREDRELRRALLALAQHEDSRRCLLLLESVLETPKLAERLMELLRPAVVKAKPLALMAVAQKQTQIPFGDDNKKGKGNSRSPAGITTRKAKATATAREKAGKEGARR